MHDASLAIHTCVHTVPHYIAYLVTCPSLTDPNNGVINCSLGDDEVPSYEDTCYFTCNTGYKLTDNDTRICQSDGSWSGSDAVCRQGNSNYVANPCNRLTLDFSYSFLSIINQS